MLYCFVTMATVVYYREVMEVPTANVLTEEKAWSYFRDIILGIEYCKLKPNFNKINVV